MPAMWAAAIAAVGSVGAAALTEAPKQFATDGFSAPSMDGGAWNVAWGGSKIEQDYERRQEPAQRGNVAAIADGQFIGAEYFPWVLLIIGGAVLWKAVRK